LAAQRARLRGTPGASPKPRGPPAARRKAVEGGAARCAAAGAAHDRRVRVAGAAACVRACTDSSSGVTGSEFGHLLGGLTCCERAPGRLTSARACVQVPRSQAVVRLPHLGRLLWMRKCRRPRRSPCARFWVARRRLAPTCRVTRPWSAPRTSYTERLPIGVSGTGQTQNSFLQANSLLGAHRQQLG
jgi:hypothetical protein